MLNKSYDVKEKERWILSFKGMHAEDRESLIICERKG